MAYSCSGTDRKASESQYLLSSYKMNITHKSNLMVAAIACK